MNQASCPTSRTNKFESCINFVINKNQSPAYNSLWVLLGTLLFYHYDALCVIMTVPPGADVFYF